MIENLSLDLDGAVFTASELQLSMVSNRDEEAPVSSPIILHLLPHNLPYMESLQQRFQIAEEHGVVLEFNSLKYQALIDGKTTLIEVSKLKLIRVAPPFISFTAESISLSPLA